MRDETLEADEKVPKILCQMDHHYGVYVLNLCLKMTISLFFFIIINYDIIGFMRMIMEKVLLCSFNMKF